MSLCLEVQNWSAFPFYSFYKYLLRVLKVIDFNYGFLRADQRGPNKFLIIYLKLHKFRASGIILFYLFNWKTKTLYPQTVLFILLWEDTMSLWNAMMSKTCTIPHVGQGLWWMTFYLYLYLRESVARFFLLTWKVGVSVTWPCYFGKASGSVWNFRQRKPWSAQIWVGSLWNLQR